MADDNNNLVNLGDLGSASPDDIREALRGRPSTVKDESNDDEPVQASKQRYLNLGAYNENIIMDGDQMKFINPYSPELNIDLDQFETKRRRVSEENSLSGILNGVEGLEENFQYTGIESVINRSEEAQGVVNKMKNGFTQLMTDTSLNVAQGFAALLYGVPSAIVNGDLTKMYDNAVANSLDNATEYLDEFYKIKRGGNQSLGQKASNFIFDDLFGAASFVMGAIATEMAFTAITAATGGVAAPAQAVATAGLVARGTRLVNKALNGGKWLMSGGMIDDALKGATQLSKMATREAAGQALRNAGKAIATPQALHASMRVGRQLITGASMEAGMEARHMLNAAVEDHKQQYESLYGKGTFTEEMGDEFREKISGYGDSVFGLNMALVGASNMLMFPKLFGVGLSKGMRNTKLIDTSTLSEKAQKRLAKNLGVEVGSLPKLVDAAQGNTWGRIVGRGGNLGRITAANTKNALYEGFVEEGGQGAISRTAEDYISKKYDPRGLKQTANFADSFMAGLAGSYGTGEGFKEIGLGMLLAFTGVPMYARSKNAEGKSTWNLQMMGGFADQRAQLLARDKEVQNIINLSERNGDVNSILKAEIENMNRQNVLTREQEIAAGQGNFKRAKDIESDMIFSHAASKILTGRYEQSLGEARQILDEISEDEFREQLGPEGKNMTDEEVRQHKTKAYDTYKARMERARRAYEQAREVYRGADPDVYTGVAHMLYNAEELDAREKRIAEKMAEEIDGFTTGQVMDVMRAQAELGLTDADIAKLSEKSQRLQELNEDGIPKIEQNIITAEAAAEARAARAREQAQLQEEIDAIKRAKETENNVNRNKYSFDPTFLENLRQLHEVKSGQQGSTYRGADIQSMYDDLVNLASDRLKVIEAYNDFIKPGGVQRFEDKMRGAIERLAQLSPEEKIAQMQAEAEEAEREKLEHEAGMSEGTTARQQSTIVEEEDDDYSDINVGEDDYGVLSEESLEDNNNLGFPEVEVDDFQEINDPSDVNADNTTSVKPAVQEEPSNTNSQPPVGEPPTPPAAPPTRRVGNTARGSAPLNLVNPKNGTPSMVAKGKEGIAAAIFENNIKEGTELRVRLLNGATANTSAYQIETTDGDVIAQYTGRKEKEVLPKGLYEAMLLNNGVVTITVSEIEYKNTRGGERVRYTTREGEQREELTREQRMLKNVLPNPATDIVGYAIMGDDALLRIGGLEVPRGRYRLSPDARYSGNTYIFTKDARDGGIAYHNVQMETFGQKRAKQILKLIDAWHDYVASGGAISPENNGLLTEFLEKADIDLADGIDINTKKVAARLQAMIPSGQSEKQKAVLAQAAKNGVAMDSLLTIIPNSKKGTLQIWAHSQRGESIASHSDINPNGRNYLQLEVILANTRMNVSKSGDVIVLPKGDNTFEVYEPDALIQEYGAFGNRMPTVLNGKVYNANPTDLVYTFEAPVEVPRGEPTVENQRGQQNQNGETQNELTDDIDYDISDIDLGDLSFLPNSEVNEDVKNPMDRAGSYYEIPGLTPREVRDGVNFGAGVMSRAMMQHMRTKDRKQTVTAKYLRDRLKRTLEAQRNAFRMQKQSATRDAIIAAHDSWLDATVFNRLVDMSLIEMMRQTKGIVELRRGNLQNIFDKLTDSQYNAAQADDSDAAERAENPLAAFDDNAAFGIDPKSTLRLEAKLVLLSLKHNPKSGLITPETFGLAGPRFMNHADLMEKINAATVGVTPSWSKVEAALQRKATTYPEFQTVLDALSDEGALADLPLELRNNENVRKNARDLQDMIRNQFTTYATKVRATRDSLRMRRQVENDEFIIREADIEIYNSNQRNMREHTRKDMRSVLISNGFFTLSGEIVQQKFQGLIDQMDRIAQAPSANRVPALAMLLQKELGLDIPMAAISSTNQTLDRKGRPVFADIEEGLGNPVANQGAYGKLYRSLKAVANRDMSLEDLMSDRSKVGGADVIDFFVSLADYRENFIQNSSKDGDGKILWQYSAPKLLHQMFDEVVYGERADLLRGRVGRMIDKSTVEVEDYRRDLQISYFGGIKQENEGMMRDFHGMEDGDLALAKLALYGNRGNTSVRGTMQMSGFLMPTLADKHTMPIVKMPALRFGGDLQFVANVAVLEKPLKNITASDVINNMALAYAKTLRPAIQKEIDRMKRLHRADYEGMTDAQRNGYAFVMMPALNGLATQLKERKIDAATFETLAHKEAAKVFENAVTRDMQHLIESTADVAYNATADGMLGAIKLFNVNRKKFQFIRDHLGIEKGEAVSPEMVKLAFLGYVAKYSMDSMAVRTGLIFDMMGDPAVFMKTDEAGNVKAAKTAVNMGKRFASLIAPGNAIPYVEWSVDEKTRVNNHTVRTLVIPARTVKQASHFEFLKKLGQTPDELAMQQGYDSADAAEYTTVQEHLSILYAQGKISRSEMMGIINKINAGKDLDPSEVQTYFQPMKPVTTGRVGDHMLYVKSAAFPLLPQFTRGTEIDKLRQFMESNDIDRAAYDSAVKLGNNWADADSKTATADQRMISVHNGAEVVTPTGLEDRVIEYDRKFMRVQQEVPVGEYKEKVHGSQVAKLFMVDLNDANFVLDGAPKKGTELYQEYIDARYTELQARKELFAQKYGLQKINGKYYHTRASRAKFAERMLEEGVTRGYDANELAYLHFDIEAGNFTTPIVASPSQERIENLIKAIIFKEVYEPMIPGYSGPIRPEVGLGVVDEALLNRNDVVWVFKGGKRVFDGKLKVARDGKPDQILLPWKYKVKLKQFLTDGNLDLDKLGDKFPEELLRTFAYRIPGQKKSSSAAFEIVGFLPEEMGDTLIVPEELVGRIGQDYDIDKMFGMLWSIEDKGGKIEIIRDTKAPARRTTPEKNTFKKSFYRGQAQKPEIDAEGNLVLKPTLEQIAGKNVGVSTTTREGVAVGYGKRMSNTPYIIELDADYVREAFDVQDEAAEGEMRIVQSGQVVIPAGKYNVKVLGLEKLEGETVNRLIYKYINGLAVENGIDEILPNVSAFRGIDYDATGPVLDLILEKLGTDYNGLLYYIGQQNEKSGEEIGEEVFQDQGGSDLVRQATEYYTSNKDTKPSASKDASRRVAAARNRMLDIYYASMTSNDTAVQQAVHSPVTDGYGEQLADILDPVSDNVGMPMSEDYNAQKAKAARSAKRTIGVMAVHNVFHSQLQQMLSLLKKGVTIRRPVNILDMKGNNMRRSGLGARDILDTSFVHKYYLKGKEFTPKAGTKSEQFSRLLNHAVDNENNGLLGRLNINQDTWHIWTGLTHMGYNQETIAMFVKLPVVQEYIERRQNYRRLGIYGRFDIATMIRQKENLLTEDQFDMKTGSKGEQYKVLKPHIGQLSKKNILDVTNNESTLENHQVVFDLRVVEALRDLEEFDKETREIQKLMRLDTNRPKSLIELAVADIEVKEILTRKPDARRMIDIDSVLEDILSKTVSGQVTAAVRSTRELFDLEYDSTNSAMGILVESGMQLARDAMLSGKMYEHVEAYVKGAKSLAYTNFIKRWTGKSAQEIRNEAHNVITGGIAQRLIEMRLAKPEIAENAFVKQLVAVKSPGTYPHIEFTGDRGLEISAVEMHRAYLSLLKSKDSEVRAFAEELSVYGVATSLGRLKSRGYMKYIPAEYLQSKGLHLSVNEAALMPGIFDEAIRQIVRHNPSLATRYVENTEQYKDTFKVIQGTLYKRAIMPSYNGNIVIGNTLYTSVGLEKHEDGENWNVMKPMTVLGDYLSDAYTDDIIPLTQTAPQVYASEIGVDSFGFEEPDYNYDSIDDGSGYSEAYVDDSYEVGEYSGIEESGEQGDNVVHDVNNEVVRNNVEPVGPQNILDHLERNVPRSKEAPFIMEMLRIDKAMNPNNPIKIKLIEPGSDSYYNRKDNTVYVAPENSEDLRTLTHEITHGLTAMGLAIAGGRIKAPKGINVEKVKAAVAELDALRRVAEGSLEKMGLKASELAQFRRGYIVFRRMQESRMDPERKFAPIAYTDLSAAERADYNFMFRNRDKYYGFIDVNEFIAEAMTNKEFAERLAKIDAVPTPTRKSFIGRFLDKISKVLSALGIQISNAEQTLLADVYAQSMNLMDLTGKRATDVAEQLRIGSDIDGMSFLPNVEQAEAYQMDSRDMLIAYKKKRVRQYQELMSRYKDNKIFRQRVAPSMLQEEMELDVLTDDSVELNETYLLAMGQRELDLAKRVIQAVDATDPEISVALSALQNVYSVIDFYGQYRQIAKDPALQDAATALLRESSELREDYLEKARIVLREAAKREFAGKGVNIDANTFEELVETGVASSVFQDASRQGRTELSFLDKIVRDASQKQRVEFNRRAKEYLDLSGKMKKGAFFKKYEWKGFVEQDAQGNPTSRIITMLNDQFDIARERKYKSSSKQQYLKWLKETSLKVNIDAVFAEKNGVAIRKKNPAYERLLEEKLGKYGAAEALRQQETRYQEFIDRREAAYDNIELTVPRAEQEEAKAVWMQENKWRQDLRFPLKEVNGKPSEFYDSRFDELMADKDAKAFYEFYRQQIMELGRMLPAHKMRKQARLLENGLFIPAINKTLLEDIMETNGYGEKIGKLTDSMKAALTVDVDSNLNNLIDPTTGRPRQELPTYFLGQLDPKTQEYDMDKTFLGFAMMATTYDSKNQVEDKVKMVRSVLQGATIIKDPNNRLNNAVNQKLRDAVAREDIMRSVDTVVDSFYGVQQRRDITGKAPEYLWTREQKAKIEELREQLLTAQSEEAKERIKKEIEDATPELSTVKAARQAQQLSQAMGMAWNLPAGIVNMVFGGLSVFKHASGRADFNEKHARKATGIMLSSTLNMLTLNTGLTKNEIAEKIQNMMINLDVLKDFTEMRYDVRKFAAQAGESSVVQKRRGIKNKLRMYEIQRSSEYFVYGQGTIATLLSIEVDGKNLWEHMDADGIIQVEGYRPGEAKHLELMNKIDQINKRIHGNYDPNSPIAIKKTTLGPLLMQFRSWLPEAIATRFEKESYDPYLDRKVKGTFRTMWNGKHLRAMIPLLLPSFVRTKGMDTLPAEISELDQENIRKFSAGVRQWLQVLVLISLLRALKDDEDKEENIRFFNATLNLAGRVETDLGLFGDPRNIFEMTQGDMLAVVGLLGRVADFVDATVETAMGEGEITTGVYAGKNKMLHHGGKLIPHINSVQRIVNQMEREMN